LKSSEISLFPNQQLGQDSPFNPITKSSQSKKIEVYQEKYILGYDDAIAILKERYDSNFVGVENNELKIQDW